jgi:hypothetical protein
MPKLFARRILLMLNDLRIERRRHAQGLNFRPYEFSFSPSSNCRPIGLRDWGSGWPELDRRFPVSQ